MLGGLSRHFVCGVKAFNLTSAFKRLVLPSTAICNAKTLFSSMSVDQDEGYVVKLRGLPWSATAQDVLEFFKGSKIVNGEYGIHMTMSREGRPSGEAFVEFEDEDHMESALNKDRDHIGNRYIEVFKVNRAEMEWVIKRNNPSNVTNDDGCVRLRGLPFGCSKEEIAQFFTGLEIVPNGITLLTDASGRSSGEAYVQFVNKEVAEKALLKHREKIGHRYIEIFRSSLSEVGNAVVFSGGRRFGGGGSGMGMGYGRPSPYDRAGDRFGGGGGGNNGGRFQPRSSRSFKGGYSSNGSPDKSFGSFGGGGTWGSNNRNGNMGGGSGGGGRDSFARFDNDYDVGWNNSSNGNMNDSGSRNSFGGGGGNDGWDNDQSEDGMHCVHMRGLPFKASQSDIADFFKPIVPVNIRLLQDKSGRASGEADVEFASHDESVRAMSNDKRHMQHRYIELFLNSADGDGDDLYSRRRRV